MSQLNLRGEANLQDEAGVRKNAALRALVQKSPAEIDTWIDANITNLAGAKLLLTRLTQIVAVLARREFEEFRR